MMREATNRLLSRCKCAGSLLKWDKISLLMLLTYFWEYSSICNQGDDMLSTYNAVICDGTFFKSEIWDLGFQKIVIWDVRLVVCIFGKFVMRWKFTKSKINYKSHPATLFISDLCVYSHVYFYIVSQVLGINGIKQRTFQDYRVKILPDAAGIVLPCCNIDMTFHCAKIMRTDKDSVKTETIPR